MPATTQLFAYGSLMFPEVWQHVVGRERPAVPATLSGHLALRVRERNFPGLIPTQAEDQTPGLLYSELDTEDWQFLDAFEDVFYDRQPVCVSDDNGNTTEASAYIVRADERDVLSEEVWTADWFAEHGLATFLRNIGA